MSDPPPPNDTPEAVRARWAAWARSGFPESADAAETAALAALDAGGTADEIAAAVRLAAGRDLPGDAALLQTVRTETEHALRALARSRPGGELTPGAVAVLRGQLEARSAVFAAPRQAAPGAPAPELVARPSLGEFLADHSIQLLAYSGAFLLAVAVLLFDLSGNSPARFWAVAALNAAFGLGGWIALRHRALRVVALSYVTLAALLLPLTGLAAYVFLRLGPLGVRPTEAVTLVAATCAAVYALLATRLRSQAYAALSLLALGVAVAAGLDAVGRSSWIGPGLAALALALVVVVDLSRRRHGIYAPPAEVATYTAAGLSVSWAAIDAAIGDPRAWPLSVALLLALAAAAGRVGLPRRPGLLWMPATVLPLAAFSTGHSLGLDLVAQRAVLLAVALVLVAAARALRRTLDPAGRGYLQVLAALLLLVTSIVSGAAAPVQAELLCAAAAVGLVLALLAGEGAWLWLPAAIFTLAWYWLVQAVLPLRPSATAADLAAAYAPLAAALLAAALAARWLGGLAWAWPLYGAAALVAAGSAGTATSEHAWQLAGTWLLVYAALTYAVGAMERSGWAAAAAFLTGTAGVSLLLLAAGAGDWARVLALGAAGLVSYAAGRLPWLAFAAIFQRYLGTGLAAAAALTGLALERGPGDAAAGIAVAVVAALVLAVDGLAHRERLSAAAAPVAASLAGVHLARLLHLDDLTWHVLLPALAVAGAGVRYGADAGAPNRVAVARTLSAAGALLLFGTTASGAVSGGEVDAGHVGWLAAEAAAGLAAAILTRSRAIAICAALALGVAALLSAWLLARATSLSVAFGVVAGTLILLATLLALLRGPLRGREGAAAAWERWV